MKQMLFISKIEKHGNRFATSHRNNGSTYKRKSTLQLN